MASVRLKFEQRNLILNTYATLFQHVVENALVLMVDILNRCNLNCKCRNSHF